MRIGTATTVPGTAHTPIRIVTGTEHPSRMATRLDRMATVDMRLSSMATVDTRLGRTTAMAISSRILGMATGNGGSSDRAIRIIGEAPRAARS